MTSIAAKIGCTAQSLNDWGKKAETDSGACGGVPTEIAERLNRVQIRISTGGALAASACGG